ncbi:7431_t:CDS:2, partial [Diversispora eburnea]
NGSNIVKVRALITELTQLPCSIHILQLVIEKELLPVEVLITRAKLLVEIMATTIMIDSNLSTRYDGRRLKSINLTEEEWQAINELIIILEDFAE